MRNLDQQTITDSALERIVNCPDARLKEVMTALIRHVHEFAREVKLTPAEWMKGIEFLTAVGRITDDKRQEFILLSDTLGLSALVDILANRGKSADATESSLLGPFFREGAPEMAAGESIARGIEGEPLLLYGRVTSTDGKPLGGARIDVWQASTDGRYDLQFDNFKGGEMNLRARFCTDADGRYRFRSMKPSSYPVPSDGPVGRMLNALGRHPYRPAHIHFIISAAGYRPLVTALYIDGDKYIDSDVVFGSREQLVVKYRNGKSSEPDSIEYNFAVEPIATDSQS
ncbi:MAG TPA: intradiol ring-cleavage dioxygenase [Candidatus Binataceae bacterium]|nr:intradiol ring-cleavage dioxygenase [Candidatus Binataceae bacterium]